MSFEWTEDIRRGKATLATGMDEVRANLDTIYAALGIARSGCASGAGWTVFPITDGVDHMLPAQPQQLRDVTDYAYENKCPAYNSGYQLGVDATDKTGYKNADLSGHDAIHNPGYYSDQHTSYDSGDLVGHCPTYDGSHNPSHCPGYTVPDNITVRTSEYGTH